MVPGQAPAVADSRQREADAAAQYAAWLQALRHRLPHYMVPAQLVTLAALPLNRSGKLDRAALPLPAATAGQPPQDDAPRGALEQQLARLWQQVLGVASVGRQTAFYALGGDSMRSIQLVQAAARAGLRFTAQDLLQKQTIAALAPAVSRTAQASSATAPADAGPMTVNQEAAEEAVVDGHSYPATDLQRWMLQRYRDDRLDQGREPGRDARNGAPVRGVFHVQHAFAFRADGVNEEQLRQALLAAMDSDNFRTAFRGPAGEERQVLLAAPQVAITLLDWRAARDDAAGGNAEGGSAEDDAEQRLRQLINADRARAFVPGQALARCYLAARGGGRWMALFSHHHAIQDGWSQSVLFQRWQHALAALRDGQPVPIPPLRGDVRRYAAQEQTAAADSALQAYWAAEVAPAAQARGQSGSDQSGSHQSDSHRNRRGHCHRLVFPQPRAVPQRRSLALDEELAQALQQQCAAHAFTARAVLFHAWRWALQRHYTGGVASDEQTAALAGDVPDDGPGVIPVAVVSNGRNPGLQQPLHAMGMFWNLVPVLRPLPRDEQVLRATRTTQQHLDAAQAHGRFPLSAIRALQPAGELFQATFNYVQLPRALPVSDTLEVVREWRSIAVWDDFGYPLQCWISAGSIRPHYGLNVMVAGHGKTHDAHTAQQLLDHMQTFVRHWVRVAQETPLSQCAAAPLAADTAGDSGPVAS